MTRLGLGLLAGGVAAIGYTWWYWTGNGGNPGPVVLAMIGVLAAAVGTLMTGRGLGGRRGLLGAGLVLFAAGIVSILTDEDYYWLPTGWGPVQVMVAGAAILGLVAARPRCGGEPQHRATVSHPRTTRRVLHRQDGSPPLRRPRARMPALRRPRARTGRRPGGGPAPQPPKVRR